MESTFETLVSRLLADGIEKPATRKRCDDIRTATAAPAQRSDWVRAAVRRSAHPRPIYAERSMGRPACAASRGNPLADMRRGGRARGTGRRVPDAKWTARTGNKTRG